MTKTKGMSKTLANNYRKLNVNVKKDRYDIWKQYAESKGLSLYALVNQLFEEAIEKDGFVPERQNDE